MNDLISIIVPVYNVEQYLEKCILSILGQTYSNLEIIIVNDGSTDGSDDIIKKYELKDSRIIHINKENGGLSSARNCGIKNASGKYVLFIDSDDFIELDCVEKLYKKITKDKSDMVIFNSRYVYENGFVKKNTPFINEDKIVDSKEAIELLLQGRKYKFHAANKFCKLSIIKKNHIIYPEGKIYEDVLTTYKLILNSKKISLYSCYLYNYLQSRSGSILDCKFNARRFDIFEAINNIYLNDKIKNYSLSSSFQVFYITNIISLYNYLYPLIISDKDEYSNYSKIIKNNLNKNYYNGYLFNKYLKKTEKIRFFMIIRFPKFYSYIMCKLRGC